MSFEDMGELIRKAYINAMRDGTNVCLDLDRSVGEFNRMNKIGTFIASHFFNWGWME